MAQEIDLDRIRTAHERISPYIHRTPVMTSRLLDELSGAQLLFKCEHLQVTGAFKMRGALNAVLSLTDEEAARGVATHSSGNHAAALARAAGLRAIPAYVVMPTNAPAVKVAAVRRYGGEITFCEPKLAERERTLGELVERHGAHFVPPYDHAHVICGQGTVALEILEQVAEVEMIVAPVGGGGLLAGVATAAASLSPSTRIIGAEPIKADDAARSFHSGVRVTHHEPATIADGLQTTLGELNFPLILDSVEEILTVSEEGIAEAMKLIWTRLKQVVEPSAAVPLAAVLEHPARFRARRVAIVLSGGNVDPDNLPW